MRLSLHGMPVQITLVGKIVSMQEQATNLSMVLDDGTGTVDLKYWIDSDETEMVRLFVPAMKEVCGHGAKRSLTEFVCLLW